MKNRKTAGFILIAVLLVLTCLAGCGKLAAYSNGNGKGNEAGTAAVSAADEKTKAAAVTTEAAKTEAGRKTEAAQKTEAARPETEQAASELTAGTDADVSRQAAEEESRRAAEEESRRIEESIAEASRQAAEEESRRAAEEESRRAAEEESRRAAETTGPVQSQPDYIANTSSHKFHYPWCHSVEQMAEHNKWYFYGNRQELINQGYVPCKNCNP